MADQPFATLDPTLRRVYIGDGRSIRLADTVGFITALPKELINAFRATLEELDVADVLLHVVDASNPDSRPRQRASVETILGASAPGGKNDALGLQQDRSPRRRGARRPAVRCDPRQRDGQRRHRPPAGGDRRAFGRRTLGVNAVLRCIAAVLIAALAACARAAEPPPAGTSDRFTELYQRLHPSVVLLTMQIPADDPKTRRASGTRRARQRCDHRQRSVGFAHPHRRARRRRRAQPARERPATPARRCRCGSSNGQ